MNQIDYKSLYKKNLKIIFAIGGFTLGLIFVIAIDQPFYHWSRSLADNFSGLMRLFKEFGFLPFWIIAAVAVLFQDYPDRHGKGLKKLLQRPLLLAGSALLSGFAAETLKLFIRRERPQPLLFSGSVFREWSGQWWKSNDLSTPSSHAAVAFGAAWALCIIYPRPVVVWVGIAILCGLSRVSHQAHLLSDVYLAAGMSFVICRLLAAKLKIETNPNQGELEC